MEELKLSVFDLPMLSFNYIQKGLFFPCPLTPVSIVPLLSLSLSRVLSLFPPLAGRLSTGPGGTIRISCNDAGVPFVHAAAPSLTLAYLLPSFSDVPSAVKELFLLDGAVSFQGHSLPLAAFQVTELGDGGIFVGCTVNHAVVDGTSFWNFVNAWAELSRNRAPLGTAVSREPDFRRNYFGDSKAVLRFPGGGPEVTFSAGAPIRERIFHFTREALCDLKSRANRDPKTADSAEISSFQSLCAQLWRSVSRARAERLSPTAVTTFQMAVNCRHRVDPPLDRYYFGNAIQIIPTSAAVADVAGRDLGWAAELLHGNVAAHVDGRVRAGVAEWEAAPRCYSLGNPDGAGVTVGSSPRFPMYDGNDFGWGPPTAVRSGRANKFDGEVSAFPAKEGGGAVDLQVCLAPETMAALLDDDEFMGLRALIYMVISGVMQLCTNRLTSPIKSKQKGSGSMDMHFDMGF